MQIPLLSTLAITLNNITSLTSFNLDRNKIQNEGCEILVKYTKWDHLKYLNLASNYI